MKTAGWREKPARNFPPIRQRRGRAYMLRSLALHADGSMIVMKIDHSSQRVYFIKEREKMKKYLFCIMICVGCLCPNLVLMAQGDSKSKNLFDWSDTVDVNRPLRSMKPNTLSVIRVLGNHFVNALGDTVIFRGVAIADPDKIAQQGRWNKDLFIKVKEMGAMIVRIPVHPASWRVRTPAKYIVLLDQAVQWCSEARSLCRY